MIGPPAKKHRLPVRVVDGAFELDFGGKVPLVDGARCDLIATEDQISDPGLLEALRAKKSIKILEKGTKLVAMLSGTHPEQVPEPLRQAVKPPEFAQDNLGKWYHRWNRGPSQRHFVEMEIGPVDASQPKFNAFKDGGLWLQVHGWQAIALQSSQIILPEGVSDEPAQSLNHAYTQLSEAYEPWRISHTGNVYEQVLYQETNSRWYPLYFLRDQKELEEGQTIAKGHWERFLAEMKPPAVQE